MRAKVSLLLLFIGSTACSAAGGPGGASSTSGGAVDGGRVELAACSDGDASAQRFGARCLCCHADEFGVAGSVAPGGRPVARVVVADAHGDVADMTPNPFGNFFRHFPMTPPFTVTAYGPSGDAVPMRDPAPSADCNGCHGAGGNTAMIQGP